MPLRRLPNRRRWQPFVTCRRLCTNSIHANERVLLSGALRQRHLVRCANGKQSTSQGAAPSKDSANRFMKEMPLYPLRFEPIYQYRPWGGRRLSTLLSAPLPGDGPIGEAWLLSDRDEHPSVVADGPLEGKTIGQMLEHPSDTYKKLIPAGETGKTEAWVVLEEGPEARIFAGLKSVIPAAALRQAIASGTVADRLASFTPKPGDTVLIPAGIIHSLRDVVVFEVQQNSDVTFRLYDWGHIDPKTDQQRPLQVDQAMACVDLEQGAIGLITPLVEETQPVLREKLIQCDQFGVTRVSGQLSFIVGAAQLPRVLVCLAGEGQLEDAGRMYAFGKGDVLVLPAVVGRCSCRPHGAVSLLEISLPEAA
jgi:mannose-6-phosphate isomerase